ncbi:MAG TPA: AAA family ATPase [Candidatus Eisenbacteria bacterium]|nr:AAA family ATPase [Candidatus Eisenbacteria bacterium]
MNSETRRIVVTGAPGTGKTAILSAITGIDIVPEPARIVLAEQRALDETGTPERDPRRFVELLLGRSIENHRNAKAGKPVLFDRGVPDCIAYALLLGADPEPCIQATSRYRYEATVLVARPWAEIYTTDDERKMTFDATLEFQRLIEEAYLGAGYMLVEIPRGKLEERAAFVRHFLEQARV